MVVVSSTNYIHSVRQFLVDLHTIIVHWIFPTNFICYLQENRNVVCVSFVFRKEIYCKTTTIIAWYCNNFRHQQKLKLVKILALSLCFIKHSSTRFDNSLTVLITGKFNNDPITGIRLRKLIATGKNPL